MKSRKDLGKLNLPKQNYKEQMEDQSLSKLRPLFHTSLFQFCKKDERDKGIDITYELIRPNGHSGFRFIVQLKSSESIEPNKTDGSYSLSIDTSNINYLLSNNCPAFYIFYEFQTDTFYYESVIEFVKHLNEKDEAWEGQESHTLRFYKKLSPGEIKYIYDFTELYSLNQRNSKESAIRISSSVNKNDRITMDANFVVTDDSEIRKTIERFGFALVNEGRWNEILSLHRNASGNIATSAVYNLILGVANYYGGNRWQAISFLKSAHKLKSELDEELQMQLSFFDTLVKFSVGLINSEEYNKCLVNLEASPILGPYIQLDQAKFRFLKSLNDNSAKDYDEYIDEIEKIINHTKSNRTIKLASRCELIQVKGYRNNEDYVRNTARLNAVESISGLQVDLRVELENITSNAYSFWLKETKEVVDEAQEHNDFFVYHLAVINEVRVLYQFNVFLNTVFPVLEIPGLARPKHDNKKLFDILFIKITRALDYFLLVGHTENTITTYSVMYEMYHYVNDSGNASKMVTELERLIDDNDLRDHKAKLERLKNGGTNHQSFRKFMEDIMEAASLKTKEGETEFDKLRNNMIKMDEDEKRSEDKSQDEVYTIDLFPIGHFQFPKMAKEKVYEILQVKKDSRKHFDELFGIITPVANIHCCPIESEGHLEGKFEDKGIEGWRNIYRIRKEFFENKFYRVENKKKDEL
jgi:hypothetical protein